jgi:hypothetical protein
LKTKLELVLEDILIQIEAAQNSLRLGYPSTADAELNGAALILESHLKKLRALKQAV